jgi:acetyl-CoA carboxylase alpha subunit
LVKHLKELQKQSPAKRIAKRYEKFRLMGQWQAA